MHLKKTPRLLPRTSPKIDQAKAREEEARDILARSVKNQAEDGPNTRRAAIRAYKYLYAMVNQHGPLIQRTYEAAKEHATRSKGTATKDPTAYRPRPQELPTVPPELTSELLYWLSTLPDPWPLAKITINMDNPSQWVSRMGRLFFGDDICEACSLKHLLISSNLSSTLPALHQNNRRANSLHHGWVQTKRGQRCLERQLFFPSNASWLSPGRSTRSAACCIEPFFPSNAFMASARSFNTFNCMLQIMLQGLISAYTWPSADWEASKVNWYRTWVQYKTKHRPNTNPPTQNKTQQHKTKPQNQGVTGAS